MEPEPHALQFAVQIDEADAHYPIVELTLTNTGGESIVLDEIGAVREDGVTFLVSEPCLTELAPADSWPFSVPLAHLDGSQGPRTIGLRVRIYAVETDEDSSEWQRPSADVVFSADFGVNAPIADTRPHRVLVPMSGEPLASDALEALRQASSRSGGDLPA